MADETADLLLRTRPERDRRAARASHNPRIPKDKPKHCELWTIETGTTTPPSNGCTDPETARCTHEQVSPSVALLAILLESSVTIRESHGDIDRRSGEVQQ